MCALSPAVRTSNISSCQKKKHFSWSCEQLLLLKTFVITEKHYETPCILKKTSFFAEITLLSSLRGNLNHTIFASNMLVSILPLDRERPEWVRVGKL
jgi:hypothetical protein